MNLKDIPNKIKGISRRSILYNLLDAFNGDVIDKLHQENVAQVSVLLVLFQETNLSLLIFPIECQFQCNIHMDVVHFCFASVHSSKTASPNHISFHLQNKLNQKSVR